MRDQQGTNLDGVRRGLTNILFTGRYFDIESQLYYYRARTYHPYLGRFLQRDPLGEAASINLYNYVFNNPVNATDPTGMHQWSQEEQMQQFAADFLDDISHPDTMMHSDAWAMGQMNEATNNQGLSTAEMTFASSIKQIAKGQPRTGTSEKRL